VEPAPGEFLEELRMDTWINFELLPAEVAALKDEPGTRSVNLACQAIIRAHLRRERIKIANRQRRKNIHAQRAAGSASPRT
jgi:hypothetical protein